MKINGMMVEIVKSSYNKTIIGEDGVTHTIDTTCKYPVYQVGMAKNYFDIENENQLIDKLIEDLTVIQENLKKIKDNNVSKKEEREP